MSTLSAKDLTCARGYNSIYEHIGFELKSGDTLLLTGANGSGKTTLLSKLESHSKRGGITVIATHQPKIFGDCAQLNLEQNKKKIEHT